MTRVIAKALYCLTGLIFLLAGTSVLSLGTGLLPGAVKDLILNVAHGEDNTLHILQEFSSLMVFAGLISLWSVWHYDRSRFFHWAMTAFWALFALVHWFDFTGGFHVGTGQVINSVPVVLFLLVGLLRLRNDSPQSGVKAN